MVNYGKTTADTKKQVRAWRTGGLRFMLALLIKDYGIEQVRSNLDFVEKHMFEYSLNFMELLQ
jgi:hypothetical protein